MFKVFSKILKNQKIHKQDYQKIQDYIMLKYFSGNFYTAVPSNFMNIYHKIPTEIKVKFLQNYFNNQKISKKVNYIPYPKQHKDQKEIQQCIDNISKYYNISKENSKEYFLLMSNNEKQKFYEMYNEG